jgi:hypothetical protein
MRLAIRVATAIECALRLIVSTGFRLRPNNSAAPIFSVVKITE